jgi:hypothetical protein
VGSRDAIKLATGTLQTVDNQIDTATGTIKLRATFENADESLFPNQFVNIRLRVRTLEDGHRRSRRRRCSAAAFGEFVYVVKPPAGARPRATVSIQRVTLGPTEGERVAVTSRPRAAGAGRATKASTSLTEGAKVEIVPRRRRRRRVRRPDERRRCPGGPGRSVRGWRRRSRAEPRERRARRSGQRSGAVSRASAGGTWAQAGSSERRRAAPGPGQVRRVRRRASGRPGRRTGSGRRAAAALMNLSRPVHPPARSRRRC